MEQQLHPSVLVQSLNYLYEDRYIHPVLYMLYDKLNLLSDTSLTFVFQKILTYKPAKLPEPPEPHQLENNEMLLFLLSELYPPKKILKWLAKVPLWEDSGRGLVVISMAIFNIHNKMTKAEKELYSKEMAKCIEVVRDSLKGNEYGDDHLSVLILALELNSPLAEELLVQRPIDVAEIPSDQLCILFNTLTSYSPDKPRSKDL